MSSQVIESIHPLAHAVGGSLGSALALLLLYPLERARIEMQAMAAGSSSLRRTSPHSSTVASHQLAAAANSTLQSSAPTKGLTALVTTGSVIAKDDNDSQPQSPPLTVRGMTAVVDTVLADADGIQQGLATTPDEDQAMKQENPLDLMACFRRLYNKGELYRGVGPLVATLATSNFFFFFFNEWIKALFFLDNPATKHRSYKSLTASCLAGICNVLITNPLWVTNLRIVTGTSTTNSMISEMLLVARQDGVSHLWKGTGTSVLLVSNPVIQFFLYEQFKTARLLASPHEDQSLRPAEAFFLGALAKAVATVGTYPLQLTQAVLRLQKRTATKESPNVEGATTTSDDTVSTSSAAEPHFKGTADVLVKLYRRDGPMGLFTGMKAKLLQSVLTAAFTFLTYEQILHAVHAAHVKLVQPQSM